MRAIAIFCKPNSFSVPLASEAAAVSGAPINLPDANAIASWLVLATNTETFAAPTELGTSHAARATADRDKPRLSNCF